MWFYYTSRYLTNEFYLADRYYPVSISDARTRGRYIATGVPGGRGPSTTTVATHVGSEGQAEDFRLVCVPAQGRSVVADRKLHTVT